MKPIEKLRTGVSGWIAVTDDEVADEYRRRNDAFYEQPVDFFGGQKVNEVFVPAYNVLSHLVYAAGRGDVVGAPLVRSRGGGARRNGVRATPGGEALYRYAMRSWTTLDQDPRDVHQVGLDELAMIDEERRVLERRLVRRAVGSHIELDEQSPQNLPRR